MGRCFELMPGQHEFEHRRVHFCRWVLGWGRAARVIEPRELRDWVKEEIAAMRPPLCIRKKSSL
jgi:predicted DNA-binding transcriptional regulator YafY